MISFIDDDIRGSYNTHGRLEEGGVYFMSTDDVEGTAKRVDKLSDRLSHIPRSRKREIS